jgi:hypothetical protein
MKLKQEKNVCNNDAEYELIQYPKYLTTPKEFLFELVLYVLFLTVKQNFVYKRRRNPELF